MPDQHDLFPSEPDIRMTLFTSDLARDFERLIGEAGFQIFSIFPADEPRIAVLVRDGFYLRLERSTEPPGPNRLFSVEAPSGESQLHDAQPEEKPFLQSFVTSDSKEADWKMGRAGMFYRDLIPDRAGGRIIASHIRITESGPVPDYVHFHDIDVQAIYCLRGWAQLVYEDQGEPFRFREGECVLQPPGIRHRVIECSGGFEVLEISAPAEHLTFADNSMKLPTGQVRRKRRFKGQTFHHFMSPEDDNIDRKGIGKTDLGLLEPSDGRLHCEKISLAYGDGKPLGIESASPVLVFVLKGDMTVSNERNGTALLLKNSSLFASAMGAIHISAGPDGVEALVFRMNS